MANIFALLVGINGYPGVPLQGCVNDVKALSTYLTDTYGKLPSISLHKLELTDGGPIPPTKTNIIAAFDHFKDAQDKDICLFYYSGHGSFAPAPPAFAPESTGYFRSFVCSDSRLPGGTDLVDKEMGALIWKVTAEHPGITFIAITDCCHSGTITKAIDNTGIKDRMLSGSEEFLPITPEQYFGFKLSVNGIEAFDRPPAQSGRITVRQGPHIHLAASRNSQTSKELMIDGRVRGAFTYALLKTLYNCGGQISYEKLLDTADAYVKNLVPDQDPGLNLNGDVGTASTKTIFLTGEPFHADPQYLVYYEPAYGWCVKAGQLQQVFKGDRVVIDNVTITTVVDSPSPDLSVLIGKPELGATAHQYSARIRRKPERLITLSFGPGFPEETKTLLEAAAAADPSPLFTLTNETPGQWILRTNETDKTLISLPGTDRPVFEPLPVHDQAGAVYFLAQTGIVITCTNLRAFTNPLQTLTRDHYSIKIKRSAEPAKYDPNSFETVPTYQEPIDLRYRQLGEDWYLPAYELTITNRLAIPLWVTNAWLDFDFGVTTDYFIELELAPGATMPLSFIKGGLPQSVVKMKIDDKYLRLGYTAITEYLKLFLSTQKIDTRHLQQEGIGLPGITSKAARSPVDQELADDDTSVRWTTETIGFRTAR
jgi:hypothetical protein